MVPAFIPSDKELRNRSIKPIRNYLAFAHTSSLFPYYMNAMDSRHTTNISASDPQDDRNERAQSLVVSASPVPAPNAATFENGIHPCAPPLGHVDHTYHDFSHQLCDGNFKGKRSTSNFPAKLHMILSNPEYSHIICWMPHGRAWKILNKDLFMKEVVPNYFVQTKYESFTRQLSGWGFKHLYQSGPDFRAYYHECFLRNLPHLTRIMKRPSHSGKLMPHVEGEPNFYRMSEQYPLPHDDPIVVSAAPSSSCVAPSDSPPEWSGGSSSDPSPQWPPSMQNGNSYYNYNGMNPPSVHGLNQSTYQYYPPSYHHPSSSYYDPHYNYNGHHPSQLDYHYQPQYSPHHYDPPPPNIAAYPQNSTDQDPPNNTFYHLAQYDH